MGNPEQFKLTSPEPIRRRSKGHEPVTEEELDEYVGDQFGPRLSEKRNKAAAAEALKKILGDKEKKEQ